MVNRTDFEKCRSIYCVINLWGRLLFGLFKLMQMRMAGRGGRARLLRTVILKDVLIIRDT